MIHHNGNQHPEAKYKIEGNKVTMGVRGNDGVYEHSILRYGIDKYIDISNYKSSNLVVDYDGIKVQTICRKSMDFGNYSYCIFEVRATKMDFSCVNFYDFDIGEDIPVLPQVAVDEVKDPDDMEIDSKFELSNPALEPSSALNNLLSSKAIVSQFSVGDNKLVTYNGCVYEYVDVSQGTVMVKKLIKSQIKTEDLVKAWQLAPKEFTVNTTINLQKNILQSLQCSISLASVITRIIYRIVELQKLNYEVMIEQHAKTANVAEDLEKTKYVDVLTQLKDGFSEFNELQESYIASFRSAISIVDLIAALIITHMRGLFRVASANEFYKGNFHLVLSNNPDILYVDCRFI